jgi:hypothetical protein
MDWCCNSTTCVLKVVCVTGVLYCASLCLQQYGVAGVADIRKIWHIAYLVSE